MKQLTTIQAIFDVAAPRLLKQNARSVSDNDDKACLYFKPNGHGCAVGLLFADREDIKQDVLERKLNGTSVHKLTRHSQLVQDFFGGMDNFEKNLGHFLIALQAIHDECIPNEWHKRLTELAKEYGLNTDCIKEVAA